MTAGAQRRDPEGAGAPAQRRGPQRSTRATSEARLTQLQSPVQKSKCSHLGVGRVILDADSRRVRWLLPYDPPRRAPLTDPAVSPLERAQDARGRARRAQDSMLAAHTRALPAASGHSAVQSTSAREAELRDCLDQLSATSRALHKALADVARERDRVLDLLDRSQGNVPPTAKRILHFRR